MKEINTNTYSKITFSILTMLYPITYILGNLAININTILIVILGIITFKNKLFDIKNDKITILLLVFFIYLIIISVINYYYYSIPINISKSFLYIRYLLLALVLRLIIKNELINLNYFYYLSLFLMLFISIDIIYQFLNNGINITNYLAPSDVHNTSFFGEDRVAGNLLRIFAGLSIIFFVTSTKLNKKLLLLLTVVLITVIGSSIFLSGGRMDFILFLAFLIFSTIVVKKFRFIFFISTLFVIITTFSIVEFNKKQVMFSLSKQFNYYNYYDGFFRNTLIIENFLKKQINKKYTDVKKGTNYLEEFLDGKNTKYDLTISNIFSGHQLIYLTAIDTWRLNPFFGNGIKSFRVTCKDLLYLPHRICATHPHNYYLGLLNNVGVFGVIILFLIIFLIAKKFFIENFYKENLKYLPFLIVIMIELIPLRSSGGFFSTHSSTLIFICLGILIGCCSGKIKKYDK